jgi:predicted GNAT family acetyltransferase
VIDDVLIAEIRDQLRDQGLDEDTVEFQLEEMQDAGMFDVPDESELPEWAR